MPVSCLKKVEESTLNFLYLFDELAVEKFALLKEHLNKVLICHYYTVPEVTFLIASGLFYRKAGSVGFLNEHTKARVYDDKGTLCGPNETGMIHVNVKNKFLVNGINSTMEFSFHVIK